jgi:hypothetical protein
MAPYEPLGMRRLCGGQDLASPPEHSGGFTAIHRRRREQREPRVTVASGNSTRSATADEPGGGEFLLPGDRQALREGLDDRHFESPLRPVGPNLRRRPDADRGAARSAATPRPHRIDPVGELSASEQTRPASCRCRGRSAQRRARILGADMPAPRPNPYGAVYQESIADLESGSIKIRVPLTRPRPRYRYGATGVFMSVWISA